jgi:hypothetical protein
VFGSPVSVTGSLAYSNSGSTGGVASFAGEFQTAVGLSYVVESKDSLSETNWMFLAAIVGDGSVKPFNDPGPSPFARF